MQSISDPFKSVDFSDVPAIRHYSARDGEPLAYRLYVPIAVPNQGSVVLIHGSSSRSDRIHPLSKAFAQRGYTAYALDIRGHGESGRKGQIAYIGQLEDDLEDFMNSVKPAGFKTLVGFSSGGGFALRFAGSRLREMFDQYLLLSPFIHQNAPTYRPRSGGWVATGVPRFIGLLILNRIGITWFNHLPVNTFALNAEARKFLTPSYSYALAQNFRPHNDYEKDIHGAKKPMQVLVGKEDEVFYADRFASVFKEAGRSIPVTILPGIGHMDLVLNSVAVTAVVSAADNLNRPNLTQRTDAPAVRTEGRGVN